MTAALANELERIPMSRALSSTMARAAEYASSQAHVEITLEHLLLALAEDEDAEIVLASSNVNIAQLKSDVAEQLGRIEERLPLNENATTKISTEVHRILEASAQAARGRRNEINGAIVLAAIVGDGNSTAANLLRVQGLTFEAAIQALQTSLSQPTQPAPQRHPQASDTPTPSKPIAGEATAKDFLARARAKVQSKAETTGRPDPQHRNDDSESNLHRSDTTGKQEFGTAEPVTAPAEPPTEVTAPPPATTDTPETTGAPTQQTPKPPGSSWAPPKPAQAPSPVRQPRPLRPPPPLPSDVPNTGPPPAPQVNPGPSLPPNRHPTAGAPNPAPRPGPGHNPNPGMLPPGAQHRTQSPGQHQPPGAQPRENTTGRPPWTGNAKQTRPMPGNQQTAPGMPQQSGHNPRHPAAQQRGPNPYAPNPNTQPPDGNPGLAGQHNGTPRTQRPNVEAGQLVENIPRTMQVDVPAHAEISIARADVKNLGNNFQGQAPTHRHELTITKAMSVRLRAPDGGFFIETASPETQWIDNNLGIEADDYATWRWNVTPKTKGHKRLQVIISARTVGADGLAAETALPDQIIDVKVRTNHAKNAKRLVGWTLAAIAGGLFARFGEQIWESSRLFVQSIMSG